MEASGVESHSSAVSGVIKLADGRSFLTMTHETRTQSLACHPRRHLPRGELVGAVMNHLADCTGAYPYSGTYLPSSCQSVLAAGPTICACVRQQLKH